MALAPFLGIQPPPVLSPRGNAEEEIALQALQHMKNVPPSSLAGNANAASGAVGTRTPQRTSATRGEGARAHARDAIRGRSNPGRPGTRRDARDTARVEDARPPRTRARVDDVVRSRQTRDSNRRTRRRSRAEVDRVDSGPSRKTVASFFFFSRIPPDRSRSLLTLETLEYPLEYPRRPPPGRGRSVQPLFGGLRPRARRARGVRQPWLALARLRQAPRVLEAQEEGGARERRRRLRHRALGDDVSGGERALRGDGDARVTGNRRRRCRARHVHEDRGG